MGPVLLPLSGLTFRGGRASEKSAAIHPKMGGFGNPRLDRATLDTMECDSSYRADPRVGPYTIDSKTVSTQANSTNLTKK